MPVPVPASATGEIESIITERDRDRLSKYDETRAAALDEARAGGSSSDLKILEDLVSSPTLAFDDFDPVGDWRCRTIKVGGMSPLIVYGWFRCRVSDDGSGWRLEKLSGSQRTAGRFFTSAEDRLTYLGAFHIAGEPTPAYGDPESDLIGIVFRNGPEHWRIELPEPPFESKLDILELKR